jgi:transposase InsO family protein
VASDGLPAVLALEIALSGWATKGSGGDPPPDPGDEPGQSAVGRTAHTWRTAQARHRGRPIDGRQVHGEEWARAGQTWKTFLHNHASGIGAMDFLVVPTINFRLLFVLVILRHERRRLILLSVTDHPTAEWIARQLTDAFPWDEAPDYMVRDRDKCYGHAVTKRLAAMGIRDHPIAPRSPWQNGHAERLIGSIRRECLDHIVVFGGPHLRRILAAYAIYYNELRTHLSLVKDSPRHRSVRRLGQLAAQPILGGLHHEYCRT